MISHADRQPTAPNRRYFIPEGGGTPFYAVVAYADDPTAEGALVNKALLDELLAASGITTGTAAALLLAQDGYSLVDGATVRFRAHVAVPRAAATLNVAGTGAKSIVKIDSTTKINIAQHAWVTVVYSAGLSAYVLQSDVSYTPVFESITMAGDIDMQNHYIDNALYR